MKKTAASPGEPQEEVLEWMPENQCLNSVQVVRPKFDLQRDTNRKTIYIGDIENSGIDY